MEITLIIKCTECGTETTIQLKRDKFLESDGFSIGDNINGDKLQKILPNDFFSVKQTSPDEMTLICKKCGHIEQLTT